ITENYSERPVIIPGISLLPNYPNYQIRNITKKTDHFIINCPWSAQKINYPHLLNLQKILQISEKKILLRFFPCIKNDCRYNSLEKELSQILGKKNMEIYPSSLSLYDYMGFVEEADLVIDSFHYGGYNTIIDAIYLNKPVITLEGNKVYNKFAA